MYGSFRIVKDKKLKLGMLENILIKMKKEF